MKKSKGLGRGIDALFQDLENLETVDVEDETVVQLPLNELRPNPYQPWAGGRTCSVCRTPGA